MKNIKTLFAMTFLLALSSGGEARAELKPQEQLAQANQAYEKGEFDEALAQYLGLAGKGYESAALFYNIGNSYYRKGERGPAILWYERALRLAPRDPDIQFNLSLSRNHLKDEKTSAFQKYALFFTVGELAFLFSAVWWLFFGLLGAKIMGWLKGELWPGLLLWSLGTVGITAGIWLGLNLFLAHQPTGIVTKLPGEVRNGPGIEYAVGFTVPEGSKIVILNRRPEWTEVGIPQQGLKGWMPEDEVETINWRLASSN